MTVNEMLVALQTRVEDPSEDIFNSVIKLEALNDAQSRVINLVQLGSLTEITKVQSPCSGNPYRMSSLSPAYYGSGGSIVLVKYTLSDVYSTHIGLGGVKSLEARYLSPTAEAPYFYIWDASLSLFTGLSADDIKVFYISEPTTLMAGGSCSLSESLQEIIVLIAEGICWAISDQPSRAENAFKIAYSEIKSINSKGV